MRTALNIEDSLIKRASKLTGIRKRKDIGKSGDLYRSPAAALI
jgi:hypothetical protein